MVLVVGACGGRDARDCSESACTDPAFPYCDRNGVVGGEPDTCVAVSCSAPEEFVRCNGDVAIACNGTSDGYDVVSCEGGCNDASEGCNRCTPNGSFCTATAVHSCDANGQPASSEPCAGGCLDAPAPHCASLVPRYLPEVCDVRSSGDTAVSSALTLVTDTDATCTGGIVQQTGGPDICVIRSKTFTVAAGATLKVTGNRAVAFVADDSVQITGTLDASADGTTSGPGGGFQLSGGAVSGTSAGGGAGFKTAGAPGGNPSLDGGAANGGAAATNPAEGAVFVGGTKSNGGGGGALMLVACRGSVVIDGVIDAGGGGGVGGFKALQTVRAASGGGSGGNVVLQGLNVVVTGSVFANGGAGGAGYTGTANGKFGDDGSRSATVPAAGGAVIGNEGGGGSGGIGSTPPTIGKAPKATDGTAGGGGASVGFLQTYTPTDVTPMLTPAEASPSFESNASVETR